MESLPSLMILNVLLGRLARVTLSSRVGEVARPRLDVDPIELESPFCGPRP
jgi:hypothetical protein